MALDAFPIFPVIFLVALAGFFSASETALFSLTRFQLRALRQKNPDKFKKIKHLLDRPAALVATVLLGNELANVFTSNILASFYAQFNLPSYLVTAINLLTVMPIILIFGEITPKVFGAKGNQTFVTFFLTPFWWFYRFSFPIRFILESIVDFLTRKIRKSTLKSEQIKEEDILILLEDGKKKGAIRTIEQEMIANVFEFDDDNVLDLSTPIRECFTVHQDESPQDVITKIKQNFYARIPVRQSEFNHKIVGILYAKDLLSFINREEKEMKVRQLMKDPLLIPSNMKAETLFRRFRQLKKHIGIVVSQHGVALGVVTMEDILEQIFGELWEESP
ncbi:MAG: hemolysin family protein [Oligoflexia bacterium]|nr:hemolysin family protein [Oligoflexia bacterium]